MSSCFKGKASIQTTGSNKKTGRLKAPGQESTAARSGRILVMDEEKMIRDAARIILSRFGYDVELAGDGVDAMALYTKAIHDKRPFDAVILDLTVSGKAEGIDTVVKLLELDPRVKVIVSSGNFAAPAMNDFKRYGFINALAKPYHIQELIDVVDRSLEP